MSIAWYLAPYKFRNDPGRTRPYRYCAMDDYTREIRAQGGDWAEAQFSASEAVVKVRADQELIGDLGLTQTFQRVAPVDMQSLAAYCARAGHRSLSSVNLAVGANPPSPKDILVGSWTSYLSGLYFGTGFRPPRGAVQAFALEAARLGLTIEEHSYDFLAWVGQHSSMLLFRLFGAFPTTGVIDAFTRADAATLGTNWTADVFGLGSASCRIVSNAVKSQTAAADCDNYYNVSTYGPDSEAYMDLTTDHDNVTNEFGGLFTRITTPGASTTDGYFTSIRLTAAANDRIRVFRMDNSVNTQLGADDTSLEFASGDGYGFETIGSVHAPQRRASGVWSAVTTRTDATYTAAGNVGLQLNGSGANVSIWDNFGGGTVVTATLFAPKSMARGMFVGMNRRLVQV